MPNAIELFGKPFGQEGGVHDHELFLISLLGIARPVVDPGHGMCFKRGIS